MTTSSSNNYNATRDQIIQRALRIIGVVGQGETIPTVAVTEAAQAFSDCLAELNAIGMPQWDIVKNSCTPLVQGQATYNIGKGFGFNFPAPLKIIQAYMRDNASNYDMPMLIIDRYQYEGYSNKLGQGAPNQLFYQTPQAIGASGESYGTITLLPVPDAYTAANKTLFVIGQKPLDDMDSGSNTLDLPPYWINAITWMLATQLAYEYGVGLSERAMVDKKYREALSNALSFDTEEGSLRIQPAAAFYG